MLTWILEFLLITPVSNGNLRLIMLWRGLRTIMFISLLIHFTPANVNLDLDQTRTLNYFMSHGFCLFLCFNMSEQLSWLFVQKAKWLLGHSSKLLLSSQSTVELNNLPHTDSLQWFSVSPEIKYCNICWLFHSSWWMSPWQGSYAVRTRPAVAYSV